MLVNVNTNWSWGLKEMLRPYHSSEQKITPWKQFHIHFQRKIPSCTAQLVSPLQLPNITPPKGLGQFPKFHCHAQWLLCMISRKRMVSGALCDPFLLGLGYSQHPLSLWPQWVHSDEAAQPRLFEPRSGFCVPEPFNQWLPRDHVFSLRKDRQGQLPHRCFEMP